MSTTPLSAADSSSTSTSLTPPSANSPSSARSAQRRRSARQQPLVNPHLPDLYGATRRLQASARARSTRESHANSQTFWSSFLHAYPAVRQTPIPTALALFITWMYHNEYYPGTIQQHLAGIGHHLMQSGLTPDRWSAARSHPEVVDALEGASRIHAHLTLDQRLTALNRSTLSHNDVVRVLQAHSRPPHLPSHRDALFCSMLIVGFLACHRVAELADPPAVLPARVRSLQPGPLPILPEDLADREEPIRFASLKPYGNCSFSYILPGSKSDKRLKGAVVRIPYDPLLRPDQWMACYLRHRQASCPTSPFLFATENGTPPLRTDFRAWLSSQLPNTTGKDLRAGGATHLAINGYSQLHISMQGRWTSDTWETYIRDTDGLALAVAQGSQLLSTHPRPYLSSHMSQPASNPLAAFFASRS